MNYDGYSKYDERVARTYDDDREGEAHWGEEERFVSQYSREHRLGRVLDLPVGTGRFLEHYREATYVEGVDISEHMLAEATAKAAALTMPPHRLTKGDALQLPHPDGSFDTVICFRLVHLLPPTLVPGLFKELSRVCSGRLLVQVYAALPVPAPKRLRRLRAIARRLVDWLIGANNSPKPWAHIASYAHSREYLVRSAETAGLKVMRVHSLSEYEGSLVEVLELSKLGG